MAQKKERVLPSQKKRAIPVTGTARFKELKPQKLLNGFEIALELGPSSAAANAVRIAREVDGLIDWDARWLGDAMRGRACPLLPPDLDHVGHEAATEQAWIKRHRAAAREESS